MREGMGDAGVMSQPCLSKPKVTGRPGESSRNFGSVEVNGKKGGGERDDGRGVQVGRRRRRQARPTWGTRRRPSTAPAVSSIMERDGPWCR